MLSSYPTRAQGESKCSDYVLQQAVRRHRRLSLERAEAEKRAALHQAMARAEVEKQAAFALGWRAQALALVAPREGPPSPRVSTPTKDEEVMMAWEPVP